MASYQSLNHSNNNQVPNFYSSEVIHGRSKTLMCLHKILRIISSFPPPETPKEPSLSAVFDVLEQNTEILRGEDKRGLFDVDLNFRLGSPPPPPPPPLEPEQSESSAENGGRSACSCGIGEVVEIDSSAVSAGFSTAGKCSVVECDLKEANLYERDPPEIEDGVSVETAIEVTDNETIEVQSTEINNNGIWVEPTGEKIKVEEEESNKLEERRSQGSLDMLIEAAKFISGEFEDRQPELKKPSRNRELSLEACRDDIRKVTQTETATADESVGRSRSKRRKPKQCWMVDLYGDFDDVSPVVRSKRGRSQVLPYKYRDSILEPWKPLSRHKSATVSTKRRSR